MSGMWYIGMWDVGDVGSSEYKIFGMCNEGCGMFNGMWDADLQNALNPYSLNHFSAVLLKAAAFLKIHDLLVDTKR